MSATAMQDALDSTIKQYHQTPATDTAGRKVLESKITDQYSTLEMMNKIMTNGKTNPAEIAKIGMAAWNTDAMAQTKYNGDMEAYLKDFANSVKQTQATYSDDMNKRKFYIKTGMTLDDAQNQLVTYKNAIEQSGNPQAKSILLGISNGLNKRKDLLGTLQYAKGWYDYLNAQPSGNTVKLRQ